MKKRILWLSNSSLANTGFGKATKCVLSRLYKTGKYEICELAAGVSSLDPATTRLPWKVIGVLPINQEEAHKFQSAEPTLQRMFAYGLFRFDDAFAQFQPDIVVIAEDIWSVSPWLKNSKYWNKAVYVTWMPYDAEPMTEEFAMFLKDFKYSYTYGKWSQEIAFKAGLSNTKIISLGVDTDIFHPVDKKAVCKFHGISSDDYIVTMVARNQVRKKFDALFESLHDIARINPKLFEKIKILPYTHYKDVAAQQMGFDFEKLWKSRKIPLNKILTPYYCKACHKYYINSKYIGENSACPFCHSKDSCSTPSVNCGLTDIQLNEIYGLSDLVILPTSNEGYGQPLSEAQAAGRITVATNYSTCKELVEGAEGYTIPCVRYIEYGTLFYKAHVTSYDIAKVIDKSFKISPELRFKKMKKAREYACKYHSWDDISKQWESVFDEIEPLPKSMGVITEREKNPNPNAEIEPQQNDLPWLISLYRNILDVDIVTESGGKPEKHQGIIYWLSEMAQGRRSREEIEQYFRQVAQQDLRKKPVDIRSLLSPLDTKRLLYVVPRSAGDNFLSTAIVESIKKKYPDHVIYISCEPAFSQFWANNPNIKGVIPFSEDMMMYGRLVDRFSPGVFDFVLTPTSQTQMGNVNWAHNGRTKSFLIKESSCT